MFLFSSNYATVCNIKYCSVCWIWQAFRFTNLFFKLALLDMWHHFQLVQICDCIRTVSGYWQLKCSTYYFYCVLRNPHYLDSACVLIDSERATSGWAGRKKHAVLLVKVKCCLFKHQSALVQVVAHFLSYITSKLGENFVCWRGQAHLIRHAIWNVAKKAYISCTPVLTQL